MPNRAATRESTHGADLVSVTRGGFVESTHRGSIAVVGADGALLLGAGDPAAPVFLRSAAKPFQVSPFLAAGGERRFRLSTEEIALACASHAGEPMHVARVERMLAKGGYSVADLRCGAHSPTYEPAARALVERREAPSALHNNCSGKHAAMLLACRLAGEDARTYLEPAHPLQRRILRVLARMAGIAEGEIGIAVDGCAAPVFRLPLHGLALAYARLFAERVKGERASERRARRRAAEAMTKAPHMVAGTGRFTTALLEEGGGRLVGKEGADGLYAVAVAPGAAGPLGRGREIGIAVKIQDGSDRGRATVVVEVLRRLGIVRGAGLRRLRRAAASTVRNVRGDVVGAMEPVFRLDASAAGGS
jgi:L-asparaginase II